MKIIFKYLLKETIEQQMKKENFSQREFEQALHQKKVEILHVFRDYILIILGVFSAAFGLKGFLLPNLFLDGGVTGISLIVAEFFHLPLSIWIVILNIPFLLMAFSTISKRFALKSIAAIILLAITVYSVSFPTITEDKLLIAVFGGFFLGTGIGLAVRGGAVLDGTEILAIYINRKLPISIGGVILIFNIIIFGVAASIFSIEISLYAILTYLSASKTVDFIVTGLEQYVAVTIISDAWEDIRIAIIEQLGAGCTIYQGKKGLAKRGELLKSTNIIYTLVNRFELSHLQTEVEKIDSNAFMVVHNVNDAKGKMIKKKTLK